jgi:DNA modification methylase
MTAIEPTWQTEDGSIRLYLADCLDVLPTLEAGSVDAVVTDPPYGIDYSSGMTGHNGGTSLPGIVGDSDTSLRDSVVQWAGSLKGIYFGSWKRQRPIGCCAVLIWEKGDHVGMGDLSMPWKPNTEEIYVIGKGFSGHRGSSVLRFNAPVSWNSVGFGRVHPHEKPLELMEELIWKAGDGCILDPFMGSGTTGVACIRTGRRFIGIEKEPKYFAIAVDRITKELERNALFEPPPQIVQRQFIQPPDEPNG